MKVLLVVLLATISLALPGPLLQTASAAPLVGDQTPIIDISGDYVLEGRDNITMCIRRIDLPFGIVVFEVVPKLNGDPIDGEGAIIYPDGNGGYKGENDNGNELEADVDSDGNLEFTVTTGPNAGRTTTWVKQ